MSADEISRLVTQEPTKRRRDHDLGKVEIPSLRSQGGEEKHGLAFDETSHQHRQVPILLDAVRKRHRESNAAPAP